MAKVKITGHASGTGILTVTAPNTSTDRTITLPDSTGTLATTADITSLTGIDDQSSSNDDQLTIKDTEVVVNEDSDDLDFRVESNGNANMLMVDASTDRIGIGIASPGVQFANIAGTGTNIGAGGINWNNSEASKYVAQFRNGADPGWGISVKLGMSAPEATDKYIDFLDDEGTIQASFTGTGEAGGGLAIQTAGTERLRIASGGSIGIGIASPLGDSSKTVHLADNVGIGFGNGANNRPDFQIRSVDGARLGFICGEGSATEDIVISTGGVLSVPQGIELGSGIDNTAANRLDDYEEGTWTPVYTGSGGSAGGSFDYSEAEGHYTKIGRLVNIKFKYTLTNNGDWTGSVIFTGLPFANNSDTPHAGSVTLHNVNFTGSYASISIPNGVSTCRVTMTNDNSTAADVDASHVSDSAAFRATFQYHTSA